MEISIAGAEAASRHVDDLEKLLRAEWPQIRDVRGDGGLRPEPLVALDASGQLAGGLSFAVAALSATGERVLWINAVLVLPCHRRSGVGSQLIAAALEHARQRGATHLYALTEIPDLYRKAGWSIHRNDGIDFVMVCHLR